MGKLSLSISHVADAMQPNNTHVFNNNLHNEDEVERQRKRERGRGRWMKTKMGRISSYLATRKCLFQRSIDGYFIN